jgi:pantoate--beta-alanine ligase
MKIIKTPDEMQRHALELKGAGRVIGFVPTMGFLHEGHLSLLRLVRERCDVLVASIFVNPAQFGPGEDLESYPRDFDRDEALLAKAAADVIFYPDAGGMYPGDASVWVDEQALSGVLCGASRPGHFRGVCTVVAKLFNLVQPDVAAFGEKDAQQLRIIERMVRDLNFPVEILRGPIIREPDGLAMSSRNAYLSAGERKSATCLCRALEAVKDRFDSGERRPEALRRAAIEQIEAAPGAVMDYVDLLADDTLQPVEAVDRDVLVALAVRFGRTRLIDNAVLHV